MRAMLAVFLLSLAVPFSASAQDSPRASGQIFKGRELYSWRDQGCDTWCYSLLPGTNRNKSLTEIKNFKVIITSGSKLKEHLANLANGEQVFWLQESYEPSLAYPPQDIVDDLVRYAAGHNVDLHVPNWTPMH